MCPILSYQNIATLTPVYIYIMFFFAFLLITIIIIKYRLINLPILTSMHEYANV